MNLLREYIRELLTEQASENMLVPASILQSVAGEYRTEPFWRNFAQKPKEEQVAWAQKEFEKHGGIKEPVDVSIFADGTYGFGDGHHRVRTALLLDEMVPIRITRNKLLQKDPSLWEYWHGLVMQGLHPKRDLNPEGYTMKTLQDAKEITGR